MILSDQERRNALTSQCCLVGPNEITDFFTGHLPGLAVDLVCYSQVTLNEPHESPGALMVESAAAGRGAEEGIPPCATDGPGKREEMDGLDPQAAVPHGEKDQDCQMREGSSLGLAFRTEVQCIDAFSGSGDKLQHHQDCLGPTGAKLPNGNVEDVSHAGPRCDCGDLSNPNNCCSSGGDSRVFTNGELLSDGASVNIEKSPSPSTSFVLCASKPQSCHASQGMVADTHQGRDESSNAVSGCASRTLSSAVQREEDGGGQESGMFSESGFSEADFESRLHSLRTFSQSDFLSEPVPLGHQGGESCPGPDGQPHDNLTFMDVSLNSRNTYEISRRQSAPDNIPGGLSVASSDPALRQKNKSISEIFSR